MPLDALVSADRIRVDVTARSKKHVLEMLAELLAQDQSDLSQHAVFDALVAREKLGCTALGHGIALPHAALNEIDDGAVAAIKLAEPLAFDDDGGPVSLVIAMIIPARTQGADNDALQAACDLIGHSAHRQQLFAAQTPAQLATALRGELPAADARQASG